VAEKSFKLEIVTPRRVVFSGDVLSFTAPGEVGGFQVLYNHAPLLSAVTIGRVEVHDTAGKVSHFATSGGFVEVLSNCVTMLAETAERTDEIDIRRAAEAKARAEERLQGQPQGVDIGRAKLALARAVNRLRIAQRE